MGEAGVVDAVRRVLSRHEPEYADRILAGGWDDSGVARIVADAVREGAAETEFRPGVSEGLEFGPALVVLRGGGRVARAGWNGEGIYLLLVNPASWPIMPHSAVGAVQMRSCFVMKTVDGSFVPWVASQSDLLASDWAVVE